MDLFGTHKISYESIRRLAIECHALDTAAVDLLIDTTVRNPQNIIGTYEELFSEKLLALAIGLRAKFYQGVASKGTECFIAHSAFLLRGPEEILESFTIKDVCDKVIHAESITRPMADGSRQPVTQVKGTHNRTNWVLHISTGLFCQGVLNWISSLQGDRSECT